MKPTIILLAALMAICTTASAQQVTKLPAPDLGRKTSTVAQAYKDRKSTREFSRKELSLQDLSDLLWAAQGQNREDGRLTAPTAMNRQEIRVYLFGKDNVSLYDPYANTLTLKAEGDHRDIIAQSQDFVREAPVVLVYVADGDAFGKTDEMSKRMMAIDVGIVSQNVNIFCSAAGFVTVPRAYMDNAAISRLLGLNENQFPMLNNPVGYPE